jgi:hypothetical protein
VKQTVILGLVAFLAAIGGGTWFAAFLSPPARPAVTALTPRPIEPGPRFVPPPPGRGKTADSSARKPAPKSGAAPVGQPARPDSAAARPAVRVVDSAALIRGAKSVAKVVASMKPKDAAGILDKLSDEEVERIVRQMNPKQIAALLTVFPQARAAGLSRKLLEPRA